MHLVLKGARLIGTNCDVKDRMLDSFVPACGSLIKPIELATGREAYFCGKPNPLIMRAAISKLGVQVCRINAPQPLGQQRVLMCFFFACLLACLLECLNA